MVEWISKCAIPPICVWHRLFLNRSIPVPKYISTVTGHCHTKWSFLITGNDLFDYLLFDGKYCIGDLTIQLLFISVL